MRMSRVLFSLFLLPWALFSLTMGVVLVGADARMWPVGLFFGGLALLLFRAMKILLQEAGLLKLPRRRYPNDPLPTALHELERTAICDAAELRRVKIVGKLRLAGKPLTAPLSSRPCCYFDARVFDENGERMLRETGGCDFFVDDGTGRALVRIKAAHPIVKLDASYRSQGGRVTSRQAAL